MVTRATTFCLAAFCASRASAFVPAWVPAAAAARGSSAMHMAAEPLGVGVIGCGRIGDIHASTLAFRTPGAKLIAVSDIFEEAGNRVQAKCGGKYYKDWKEMVHDPEVQAVVIGSPTPYHAEQILECAKLKKHIFCEKPISFDLNTIDECMQKVDEAGVQLILGFQRRFDDNFRAVRKQIEAGAIEGVRTFHITSRDPAPPPADYLLKSGGIFNDMVSHDFDMARFLAGDGGEVEEVFVMASAFDPEAAEAKDFDTTSTMLKFTNGAFGVIENSRRCAYGYDQRVEVFGKAGSVHGFNRAPTNTAVVDKTGTHTPLIYSFFMDRYADAYVNIMNAFVKCVINRDDKEYIKQQRPAFAEDGKMCILIALAAAKSAEEHRPVKIAEIIAEKYGKTEGGADNNAVDFVREKVMA